MPNQSEENLICMFTGYTVIPSVFHCSLQCPFKNECDLSDTCCMEDQENCGQDNCPHILCLGWKHHFLTEHELKLTFLRQSRVLEYFAIEDGLCTKDDFGKLLEKYKKELSIEGINIDLISKKQMES
jgi:hypothetical protein